MRARHSILAFIGLGLVATIACSRNANQANFIGADCAAEADCPAELVCVNKKCWEPCGPDGSCKSGYTCVLGACQQSGSVGTADNEGGVNTDPQGEPIKNPVAPGMESDGEPIVTGITLGSGVAEMRCAGTRAYIRYEVTDPLSGQITKVVSQDISAATTWAPKDIVSDPQLHETFAAAGGYVLYAKKDDGPTGEALYRRAGDASGGEEKLSLAMGNAIGNSMVVDGEDIFYVDDANALRLFNFVTNTSDATSYGSVPVGASAFHFGKNASELIWVVQDVNGGKVFYTTKGGGAGTDKGITGIFQMTMIQSVYPANAKLEMFVMGGGSPLLYEAAPGGAPSPVSGWSASNPIFRGNAAYYVKSGPSSPVLAKFDFVTKTETLSTQRIGFADAYCLGDNAFYAIEKVPEAAPTGGSTSSGGTSGTSSGGTSSSSGSTGSTKETFRIAKFALP